MWHYLYLELFITYLLSPYKGSKINYAFKWKKWPWKWNGKAQIKLPRPSLPKKSFSPLGDTACSCWIYCAAYFPHWNMECVEGPLRMPQINGAKPQIISYSKVDPVKRSVNEWRICGLLEEHFAELWTCNQVFISSHVMKLCFKIFMRIDFKVHRQRIDDCQTQYFPFFGNGYHVKFPYSLQAVHIHKTWDKLHR